LTIKGAAAGIDARDPSRGNLASESLISGGRINPSDPDWDDTWACIDIKASDVTLDGLVIENDYNSPGGSEDAPGVLIRAGVSGTRINNDIVQKNVTGLYLANSSSVDPAVIQHSLFASNNNNGNNSGRGIYSNGGISGGTLNNVLIDS